MDKMMFYPMLAMVVLTAIVAAILARRRFGAIKAGETTNLAYFKTFQGENPEPERAQQAQRNFLNLFEMPVLFYPACLAAMILEKNDIVTASLAWAYVMLRFLHSYVHLTGNNVPTRFRIFFLSNVMLVGLWASLAI